MRRWLTGLALLASGCSIVNAPGDHTGGAAMDAGVDAQVDAGPEPIPANLLCSRYAQFACSAYVDCCPSPDPGFDYDSCVSDAEVTCAMGFGTLIADRRTGYDETVAAEVLREAEAFASGEPSCDPDIIEFYVSRTGFQRLLGGTVAGGGDCTPRSLDVMNPDVAAFFSCDSQEQACFLSTAIDDWICRDRRQEGDECVFYFDCEEGLRCARSGVDIFGACAQRLPDGSRCREAADCASLVCAGDTCQPRTVDIYCAVGAGLPSG